MHMSEIPKGGENHVKGLNIKGRGHVIAPDDISINLPTLGEISNAATALLFLTACGSSPDGAPAATATEAGLIVRKATDQVSQVVGVVIDYAGNMAAPHQVEELKSASLTAQAPTQQANGRENPCDPAGAAPLADGQTVKNDDWTAARKDVPGYPPTLQFTQRDKDGTVVNTFTAAADNEPTAHGDGPFCVFVDDQEVFVNVIKAPLDPGMVKMKQTVVAEATATAAVVVAAEAGTPPAPEGPSAAPATPTP